MTKLYSEKIDLTRHQDITDNFSTLGTAEFSVDFSFAQKYNPNRWRLNGLVVSIYNRKNNIVIERANYDSAPTHSECRTITQIMDVLKADYLIGSIHEQKYTKADFMNSPNVEIHSSNNSK